MGSSIVRTTGAVPAGAVANFNNNRAVIMPERYGIAQLFQRSEIEPYRTKSPRSGLEYKVGRESHAISNMDKKLCTRQLDLAQGKAVCRLAAVPAV